MQLEAWERAATLGGTAIVVVAAIDVILTVLHQDLEGPIARSVQRWTWACFRLPARRLNGARRGLLATAGPVMMIATFVTWVALFVLGFGLIYWPVIDSGYMAGGEALEPRGFIEALYFSGTTATVLGFGDISPTQPVTQTLSIVESGLGFALLTAVVTYLQMVQNALGERNTMALRLHHELREDDGDGIDLVLDWLEHEEGWSVARRLDALSETLVTVQERLHRFPLVSLYYRSAHRGQDPEPALERLTEITLAARVAALGDETQQIRPSARLLSHTLSDFAVLLAPQHIDREAAGRVADPHPEEADRRTVEELTRRLGDRLAGDERRQAESDHDTLILAFRMRVLLDGLDRQTIWRSETARP